MATMLDIKAVVFDAYGTLVRFRTALRPYARLAELSGKDHADFRYTALTSDCPLRDLVRYMGVNVDPAMLSALEATLAADVAGVVPFDDAQGTVSRLRDAGIRVAICSNLAQPYAEPVLSGVQGPWDASAWSFAVGRAKPEPAIYAAVCERLDVSPAHVLMVGDTYEADVVGPQAFGMQARWLRRAYPSGAQGVVTSLRDVADELLGA